MNRRQQRTERRRVLKTLGLGAGAMALASGPSQAQSQSIVSDAPTSAKQARYRETPHVLTYYDTL